MSVQTTILTSPTRIKTDTDLNDSVDDNLLYPAIVTAQERHAHPVLGTKLYDKLKTLISDGTIADGGNADYKTLLDTYIVPMLVQYAFVEVIPVLRLRFLNNSVVAMGSEQSTTATADDIKPIMHSADSIGSWYKERLIEHLCDNTGTYPEYRSNTGDDVQPTVRNYTQGLNLEQTFDKDTMRYVRGLLGL